MTTEEYRTLLESCLAAKIIEQDKAEKEAVANPAGEEWANILRYEVNGLCLALRLLGDYGTTNFNIEWATRPVRGQADWEKVLDASYLRPVVRY